MLQNQYYYNLIDAIVYLIAAIIQVNFILKSNKSINNNDNHFRKLTNGSCRFYFSAGYLPHCCPIIGFRLLAKGFLEPLSMAALLFLGAIYLIRTEWKLKNSNSRRNLRHDKYI